MDKHTLFTSFGKWVKPHKIYIQRNQLPQGIAFVPECQATKTRGVKGHQRRSDHEEEGLSKRIGFGFHQCFTAFQK